SSLPQSIPPSGASRRASAFETSQTPGFELPASGSLAPPKAGLQMNGRAMRGMGCFTDRFRERRMCVDCLHKLFQGAFEPQREDRFCDQFGGSCADHMDAEDFVVLLVGNDLDEAFRFTRHLRAAKYAKRERTDANVVSLLPCFRLGKA